eukprot:scaffold167605_cov21-Tisochrysis_lutea.AAC.1
MEIHPCQHSIQASCSWVPRACGACLGLQVNVGEDEPEDIAVRKFMKKVMESGVIEEVSECLAAAMPQPGQPVRASPSLP